MFFLIAFIKLCLIAVSIGLFMYLFVFRRYLLRLVENERVSAEALCSGKMLGLAYRIDSLLERGLTGESMERLIEILYETLDTDVIYFNESNDIITTVDKSSMNLNRIKEEIEYNAKQVKKENLSLILNGKKTNFYPLLIGNENENFHGIIAFEIHNWHHSTEHYKTYLGEIVRYISYKINIRQSEIAIDKEKIDCYLKKEGYVSEKFLLKVFEAIASLSRTDSYKARKLAVNVEEYIKKLSSNRQYLIPLGNELELVKLYYSIEKECLESKVKLFVDVPGEMLRIHVPAFSILPLVENSINHGIALKPSGGSIFIKALEVNNLLEVVVWDTGVGMPAERLDKILKEDVGMGLKIVREGLKNVFGDSYKLDITSSIEEGTRVTVCIPKKTEQGGEKNV